MLNINKALDNVVSYISNNSPWTNVLGLSRTILASGTFLTLSLNSTDILFTHIIAKNSLVNNVSLYRLGFFNLLNDHLGIAKYIALLLLLLVIIGWRPRYTSFFHFWITLSFFLATETPDGGDQVSAILSLLFFPIALLDSRKWHWSKNTDENGKNFYTKGFCFSIILMMRIQISTIYLHAATSKFKVNEWVNGTAVWYWFKDPMFGSNYWISLVMQPVIKSAYGVTLITWGSLILELFLFTGLVMQKKHKKNLLVIGLLFHFSILVIQGLASFFFAMAAALIIYLRPVEDVFDFRYISFKVRNSISKMKAKRPKINQNIYDIR